MALATSTESSSLSLSESKILLIDNLVDKHVTVKDVEDDLQMFGEIVSIWTKVQESESEPTYRGVLCVPPIEFVFVEFESKMATQAAKHWLDGKSITGGDCIVRVNYASQEDIDKHSQLMKFDHKTRHCGIKHGKVVKLEQQPSKVNQQENLIDELPALPEEVLLKILKYSNNSSLLTHRLVCQNWKNTIDNSIELMRRLTFCIYDLDSFEHSTVAGKAKNIVYKNGTALPIHLVRAFYENVGPSLEIVKFGFNFSKADEKKARICRQGSKSAEDEIKRQESSSIPKKLFTYHERKDLQRKMIYKALQLQSSAVTKELKEEMRFQRTLFSLALKYCTNLKEINFPHFARRHLFNNGMNEAEMTSIASSTINELNVHINSMSKRDFGAVKDLIRGLPQLSVLKVYGADSNHNSLKDKLFQFLIDFMENGRHVLKKFKFHERSGIRGINKYFHLESDRKSWIQLLMKAAEFSIIIESPIRFHLNSLIELQTEQDFPMEASNSFSQLTRATFEFYDEGYLGYPQYYYSDESDNDEVDGNENDDGVGLDINDMDINYLLNTNSIIEKCCGNNLVSLEIEFSRPAFTIELGFLPHLTKLEELKLTADTYNSVKIPQEILQWEMASVKSLCITGGIELRPFRTNQMQTFAPNLTHLAFRHINFHQPLSDVYMNDDLPADFILSLSTFVQLVSLEFEDIYKMTETAFIVPCPTTNLPAIATLQQLKQLTIRRCDASVCNGRLLEDGISYCPNLEKLTISPGGYGRRYWSSSSSYNFDSKILQDASNVLLHRAGLSREKHEHRCHFVYEGDSVWNCSACDKAPATIIFSKY